MAESRIFLVEDNPNLGFTIADGLRHAGFEVDLFSDGVSAAAEFNADRYDLCLLDIMLPKLDGFSLAELIRKKDSQIPMLFLTARSLEEDKLKAFRLGGDDYITKPFSMKELICRIDVFLKRSSTTQQGPELPVRLGSYLFDYKKLVLDHEKENRTLTQREADVLKFLWDGRCAVRKRDEILKYVWGDDDYFMGRSLDVFIARLRKYLRHDQDLEIRNYHGVGFSLIYPD